MPLSRILHSYYEQPTRATVTMAALLSKSRMSGFTGCRNYSTTPFRHVLRPITTTPNRPTSLLSSPILNAKLLQTTHNSHHQYRSYRSNWYQQSNNQYGRKRNPFSIPLLSGIHPVYLLIGANSIVFLGWQYGRGNMSHFRDSTVYKFLMENFTVSLRNITEHRYWTLLTCSFSHEDLFHFAANMFVLWQFAPIVYDAIGRNRFFALWGLAALGGSIGHLMSPLANSYSKGSHAHGASGALSGLTAVFACLYPRAQINLFLFIPMPAWVLVSGLLAYDAYNSFRTQGASRISYGSHIGGTLAGLAFYFLRLRRGVF